MYKRQLLDATKTFDRVNYCKLFCELLKRDLPAGFLRLLLNMYTNDVAHVFEMVCQAGPSML